MDTKEIANIVYDTLMQNTMHKQLDIKEIENSEIGDNIISFDYLGLKVFLHVTSEPAIGEGENTCDKCLSVKQSFWDLIWLTAEDFEPFEGEVIDWEAVKTQKLDAVCEKCYQTLLIKKCE